MWTNRYKYKGFIDAHTDWVNVLSIYNNNFIISGSSDKTAKIWSITDESCITTLSGHTEGIYGIYSIPNYVVTSSADTKLRVFSPNSSKK